MPSAEPLRRLVTLRADAACEYCLVLEAAIGTTFHIDHILPLFAGGETTLSNLALSCPGCNLAKSNRTVGNDDEGEEQRLFNPRAYDPSHLGWRLHFQLDRATGKVLPRTRTGAATINALRMNEAKRVFARKLQIDAGLLG